MNKKQEYRRGTPHRVDKGVGIYIRKSTDRQELSLPAQERLIRGFLADQKIDLPITIYPDILSGRRPDRAGYQRMLADARAGKLGMIVFHKVNRFGRNAVEGLAAIELLRHLGVEVRIVDIPSLDIYKPEGTFLFTILLGQGQYQVEDLATEAIKGMREKVEQGGWPFRAPDGYVNKQEEIEERRVRSWVEVSRPRAAIVRLIHLWYSKKNTTLNRVANQLNRLHAQRVAQGKSECLRRSGKPWDYQSVYRVLTNRFYIGDIEVPSWDMQVVGTHTPIIRRVDFERVQAILGRQGGLRGQTHHYLLQGLLYLGEDETAVAMYATIVRSKQREFRYYYIYRGNGRVYYDATTIEDRAMYLLRNRLATLGNDPHYALRQRVKAGMADVARHAQTRLHAVLQERQNLLRLAMKGRFSEAEVDVELRRLGQEENWARNELARMELIGESHEVLLAEASADITAINQWHDITIDQRQEVLRRLIQGVYIDAEGLVRRVVWQPLWDMLWFGPAPQA